VLRWSVVSDRVWRRFLATVRTSLDGLLSVGVGLGLVLGARTDSLWTAAGGFALVAGIRLGRTMALGVALVAGFGGLMVRAFAWGAGTCFGLETAWGFAVAALARLRRRRPALPVRAA
jgi:hypothetical protein